MNKLKIYLGDMTYDTITLSTETFPLNIGFIASYCLKNLEKKFQDVANYCRGLTYNILGKDRISSNFEHVFKYDLSQWLKNNSELTLDNFEFGKPTNISFKISDEQYKVVQNEIDRYGTSITGLSKATKHLQFQFLLRKPSFLV